MAGLYNNTVIPSNGSDVIVPARDQNVVTGVTPEITKIIEIGIPGPPGPAGPPGADGTGSGFPYTGSAIVTGSFILTGSADISQVLTANSAIIESTLLVKGNVSFGNNSAIDVVSFRDSTINSDFNPRLNATYNLGNPLSIWDNIYANSASVGYVNFNYISGSYGEFNKVNINGVPILSSTGNTQFIGDKSADRIIINNSDFEVSGSLTVGDSINVTNDVTASNGLFDILILKNQDTTPTPISGGVYYSNGEFFMGI